uniref:cadherin repeat domain-containing protein n=1 Tax=Maribacter sp. TaxID=1897614 RepID=UPI0025C3E734
MKKIILPALAIVIASCSSDKETDLEDIVNSVPIVTTQELQVKEHTASGTSVGTIAFSDKDKTDELTITIDSDAFIINETTGEVSVGPNAILDFEATSTITFTVSVFDGTAITEQNILLTLEDIDEYTALSDTQKELADYFRYLALWENSNNLTTIQKWGAPMKIFLDGNITTQYRTTVQGVLDEYNALFNLGDFSISLVDNLADSN